MTGKCEKCHQYHGVLIDCEKGEVGFTDEEIKEALNAADNS